MPKSGAATARGSSALEDWADSVLMLKNVSEDSEDGTILSFLKTRWLANPPSMPLLLSESLWFTTDASVAASGPASDVCLTIRRLGAKATREAVLAELKTIGGKSDEAKDTARKRAERWMKQAFERGAVWGGSRTLTLTDTGIQIANGAKR